MPTVARSKKLGRHDLKLTTQSTYFEYFVAHQLEFSASLISIILSGYFLKIPYFDKFVELQGLQSNGLYLKDSFDTLYVVFYFLAFTLARTFLMEHIFVPFIRWYGVKSKTLIHKFKEQAFQFVFYICSWTIGMILLKNSPYWFDLSHLWIGYPHLELPASFKSYYLIQMGFWLQQMYFVQIEVRRKDYLNMLTHHIVTNLLIIPSYLTNYTRLGHIMLVLMDFADIFLTGAKVLNYLKAGLLTDIMFGVFAISWIASRHVGFMIVVWSIMVHPLKYHSAPKWDPENGIFFTHNVRIIFLTLLMCLQVLMILWFSMILKIIYKIVMGGNAADVRSSGEDEEEQLQKAEKLKST